MEMALAIFSTILLDLLFGVGAFWLLLSGGTKKTWGWGVLVLYVMATIGQQMEAEYLSVGAFVRILAFMLGALIAFGLVKWRARRAKD